MEKNKTEEVFPLQLIQQLFEVFVSKISENQLSAEVSESDTELSTFIIQSFSKLFSLWNKHLFLRDHLKSNLFYDVYSQMFDSFNYNSNVENHTSSENAIPLECKICDQEFTVMINDYNYAYVSHLDDPTHVKMVNVLQKCGQNDPGSSTLCDEFAASMKLNDETKGTNIIGHGKLQDSEIKDEYIIKKYYCELCKILTEEKELRNHVDGKGHFYLKGQLEKFYRLNQRTEYIKIIDANSYEFICKLCNISNAGWPEIVKHCSSANHKYLKSINAVKSSGRTRKHNRKYTASRKSKHAA